jgi:hypothetical protein
VAKLLRVWLSHREDSKLPSSSVVSTLLQGIVTDFEASDSKELVGAVPSRESDSESNDSNVSDEELASDGGSIQGNEVVTMPEAVVGFPFPLFVDSDAPSSGAELTDIVKRLSKMLSTDVRTLLQAACEIEVRRSATVKAMHRLIRALVRPCPLACWGLDGRM